MKIRPEQIAENSLLKSIYMDVLKGYSEGNTERYGKMFIKHLDALTSGEIDETYREFFNKAKNEGLPTNEDQEEYIKDQEIWSRKEDERLVELENALDNLHRTKRKVFLKSQVDSVNEEIEKIQKEHFELIKEKEELLGFTAEKYANKKVNEFYMYKSLYKDAKLTKMFFEEEGFEDISFRALNDLMVFYNERTIFHNEWNLKRVALSPFFLNYFYLCDDNPFTFFGKPVVDLTYLQTELFGYARYFKNLLSNCKNEPDKELYENPEKLIEYLEGQKMAEKLLDKMDSSGKENQASTVVGATKEDLKLAGIKSSDNMKGKKTLSEAVAEKGKSLSMEDMIKLHGG